MLPSITPINKEGEHFQFKLIERLSKELTIECNTTPEAINNIDLNKA